MFKVSVIVPVYNTEKYIERCLESILNQTYKEIEIIVVNDGSTDNSQEIINLYVKKYENVKSVIQENSRQGAARNNGIKLASGEFIMFVDSDDYIFEDSIETLINIISNNNIAVGAMVEDKNGYISSVEYVDKILCKAEELKLKNLKNLKESAKLSSSCHKLFRKSFLVDNNIFFPEKIIWEDGPFNLNAWLKCENISYINKNVYCRTIRCDENNKSTIQTINKSVITDDIKSHTISINLCKEYNDKDLIESLIRGFYLSNIKRCIKLDYEDKKCMEDIIEKHKDEWLNYVKKYIGVYKYIKMKALFIITKFIIKLRIIK